MNLITRKVLYPAAFLMLTAGMCVRNTDVYKSYQQHKFESDLEKGKELLYEGCDNWFERCAKTAEIEFKSKLNFKSTDEYIVDEYRERTGEDFWHNTTIWGALAAIGAVVLYKNVSDGRKKAGYNQNNKDMH